MLFTFGPVELDTGLGELVQSLYGLVNLLLQYVRFTFGTVELDTGLGELVQSLGQVQGLHPAQFSTHRFHSLQKPCQFKANLVHLL